MTTPFEALREREAKVICKTYGRYPLALDKAQGARLFDLDGKEYVDLLAGLAVVNLGHARADLALVAAEQAQRLVHVSNLFYTEPQVRLAEKLVASCCADKVFFCNSGAEANEAAIKLARRYMRKVRGRDAFKIISLESSFHGRTLGTLGATGQPKFRDGFEPLPAGYVNVPAGDMDAMAKAIDDQCAAVLVEIVQGEGGVNPMTPDYAKGLEKLCRERDALLIVDEIQTGLGRTGKMWAFQHFDMQPDIFTTAKGLANGLPMGAMLATDEVARGFEPGTHATTFGGGPVLAAVACKVLDILEDEQLVRRSAELGARTLARFQGLAAELPEKIVQARGLGLMLAVELAFPAQEVWKQLLELGFVCNVTQERTLRLLPPLVIEEADLIRFAEALRRLLTAN